MHKTPVTIFSGYLGSGKTTIIANSLKKYDNPVKYAMIKNEYGDASVDGSLLQLQNLAVKELINGCLCCILVGSLNDAVNELIDSKQPDRIIIEASGDALPFPIILELKKNDRVYVDGVISVVDCVNFERVKDTSMVARQQAKHTDLIIFNKAGLVDEEKLYRVKEEIYGINPDTVKIDTDDGCVDPAVLFGLNHHELVSGEVEIHDHSLETFTYKTNRSFDIVKLKEVLAACQANSFYRIKGIVCEGNGQWNLVNRVFGDFRLSRMETPAEASSRIIFIGKDIKKHQPVIEDYLDKSLTTQPTAPEAT